jgi:FixJ family two-component response regulator
MRALLESYGIEVHAYASAREFLVASPAQPGGCVLVDLHMPGMGGLELLEALKAQGSRIPVIAITGRSDSILKERATRAGAVTLLEKPVSDEALLSTLMLALARAEFRAG